jgi:hypothetical protein
LPASVKTPASGLSSFCCPIRHTDTQPPLESLSRPFESRFPAIRIGSLLDCLTCAFPSLAASLIVHMTRRAAVCVAFAHGHLLSFTYQTVPILWNNTQEALDAETTIADDTETPITHWNVKGWQDAVLPTSYQESILCHTTHPFSLVVAIQECLKAAPRDIRRDLVSHLLFTGEMIVLFPQLGSHVARALQDSLRGSTKSVSDKPDTTADETLVTESLVHPGFSLCTSANNTQILAPLADHVRVLDTGIYRPDQLAWLGASLWTSYWHSRDPSVLAWEATTTEVPVVSPVPLRSP